MSTFGQYFRVSTYGESHGKSVGCIVDGVPPGLKLTEDDIQPQMTRRRPGQSALTTPRDEKVTKLSPHHELVYLNTYFSNFLKLISLCSGDIVTASWIASASSSVFHGLTMRAPLRD